MRDWSSLHFADISPKVMADELFDLPSGKASFLYASTSVAEMPRGGKKYSPDVFSETSGVAAVLAPFASGAEAERLGCILTMAAPQQIAAKREIRPIRAKEDMIERPCFRNFSRVFPDPLSGDLRTVLRSSFCCRVYEWIVMLPYSRSR